MHSQKNGFPLTLKRRRMEDLVAQLVEHNTFNVGALGSSPSGITDDEGSGKIRTFFIVGARWDEKFIPHSKLSLHSCINYHLEVRCFLIKVKREVPAESR